MPRFQAFSFIKKGPLSIPYSKAPSKYSPFPKSHTKTTSKILICKLEIKDRSTQELPLKQTLLLQKIVRIKYKNTQKS